MTVASAPRRDPFLRAAARALGGTVRSPRFGTPGTWGTAQYVVVAVIAALNLLGLAMVLSASSVTSLYDGTDTWFHFRRQGTWIALGTVSLLAFRFIDYHVWRRLVPLALGATIVLLIAVLIPQFGVEAKGASRWVGVGPVTVQPTELLKLAMVLYSADLISKRNHALRSPVETLLPVLIVFISTALLVMLQPDLGSLIIVGAITFGVLFAGGVSLGPLFAASAVGASAALVLAMTEGYRRNRLLAFLDPWEDPLNTGYQTIQSLVGVATGGVTGVGIGEGRSKWGYLPEAHTDFIYAVVGEEMGFIGSVMVLALFATLAAVGVRIALRAPDRFGTLLALGIVVWLVAQALVNVGTVLGVLPITGVPLPFVSFGGTSLVVGMAAIGMLLNVGRQGHA
ncbi:MAG: putative lipid II flippase FtsW [Acidimicrobiales bacterium]